MQQMNQPYQNTNHVNRFSYMAAERPALIGHIRGGIRNPDIIGLAAVHWLPDGLFFTAEINGLPPSEVLAFHVHEGAVCRASDDFSEAGDHLSNCGGDDIWCGRHPYHAGDLPPVMSDENGYAFMSVYIGKASVSDYSGRTVIVHNNKDDFTTQPSGASAVRIACGVLTENL